MDGKPRPTAETNGDSSLYNVQMPFIIAGNHPILEDAEKESTVQLKLKFQVFSKTSQKEILASRRAAVESSLNCSLTTNKTWQEQCRKVSRKEIYDGQYAVKVTVKKPAKMEDIKEDRSFKARTSTVSFIVALKEEKDLITAQILKRRNEQQTKAAEDRTLRDLLDSSKLLLEECRVLGSGVISLEGHCVLIGQIARRPNSGKFSGPKKNRVRTRCFKIFSKDQISRFRNRNL